MAIHFKKVPGEPLLYTHEGKYFLRKQENGADTHVSLQTSKKSEALRLRDDYKGAKRSRALGLVPPVVEVAKEKDEDKVADAVTVRTILTRYRNDGHPNKRGNRRIPVKIIVENLSDHMVQEQASILVLDAWFKDMPWDLVTQNVLDNFHNSIVEKLNPDEDAGAWVQGHRTTDLHNNCLANAFNWAVRKELIKYNPIASRTKYYQPSKARHAKDVAPGGPGEMHNILDVLFEDPRSEVLGMQAAYEYLSGQRTEEAINLRTDAMPGEPGYRLGDSLTVRRAKKADRENCFAHIHQGMESFLKAHAIWLKLRYPKSPWFFPGRDKDADTQVGKDSLTHRLDKLFETGLLKQKVTSHGLRGEFVLHRRSWGIQDSQIALEINQIGGVATLQQSYGMIPPHWLDGKGPKMPWLPKKRKPAWDILVKKIQAALRKRGTKKASISGR